VSSVLDQLEAQLKLDAETTHPLLIEAMSRSYRAKLLLFIDLVRKKDGALKTGAECLRDAAGRLVSTHKLLSNDIKGDADAIEAFLCYGISLTEKLDSEDEG